MLCKSVRIGTVVFALFFVLSSAAWAVSPDDALTGRLNSTFRLKLRLDSLEKIEHIFDHPIILLYSALLREEKTGGVMYALNLAFGLRPKSMVFVVGTDAGQTFFQMAVSMPETALPQLKSIELGIATKMELAEFLSGENQMTGKLDPVVLDGDNGPYYLFKDTIFLAARENLLLMSLSPEDLTASLNALDKAGVRRFL